eukprot:03833_6
MEMKRVYGSLMTEPRIYPAMILVGACQIYPIMFYQSLFLPRIPYCNTIKTWACLYRFSEAGTSLKFFIWIVKITCLAYLRCFPSTISKSLIYPL